MEQPDATFPVPAPNNQPQSTALTTTSPKETALTLANNTQENLPPQKVDKQAPSLSAEAEAQLKIMLIFAGYLLSGAIFALTTTANVKLISISVVFSLLAGLACVGDLALFGQQKRPYQWLLSAAFIVGLATFSMRVFMPMDGIQTQANAFGLLGVFIEDVGTGIRWLLPKSFEDLFDIWKALFALFALLMIMRLHSVKIRASLIVTLLAFPILFLIANESFWQIVVFILGMIPFIASIYFHFEPVKGAPEMQGVIKRLQPVFNDNRKLACNIFRAAVVLHEGNPVPQNEVAKVLDMPASEVFPVMIQMGIATTYASKDRNDITLDPDVRFLSNRTSLTGVIHKLLLVLVAAGWALLPYDLIPDSIPFYGCLDDIIIAFLVFRTLYKK